MKKVLLLTGGLILIFGLWYWTERQDYFISDYKDFSPNELPGFDSVSDPTFVYKTHIGDERYKFPGQHVDKVKLFENKPFLGTLTSKTLKKEFNQEMVKFFNDSTNFRWSETTWSLRESEYILRFYNEGKIIGKIYLCLEGCGMTATWPFTPNTKFGGLTTEGKERLESMLTNKKNWD
jgi:hypothetical protein